MLTPPYTFSPGHHTFYSNSGIAAQLLQLCGYNDSIHDRNNVSRLLSDLFIRCGQDLQLLQNSYSSFDLISQIGEEICTHISQISRFKTDIPISTPNLYLRRKLIKRKPLAVDTLDYYTRQDAVLRDLKCLTRSINIWAYGQPPEPDAQYVTTPSVSCISFDQTAKVIITGGDDGFIKLWHFHTGSLILSMYRHSGTVASIHVHSNNSYIVSACTGGECRLWEIRGSWWRMCCLLKTSFKILWCKFTRGYTPFKGQVDDFVIYASGDDTLKLHLVEDLLKGLETPMRIINLNGLRAYDISEHRNVPWIAVGLESNGLGVATTLGGNKFGVGGVLDLDFESWGVSEKKYIFSWDFDEEIFKKLTELGILSQIKAIKPLHALRPGGLSIKYSDTITGNVERKPTSNFIPLSSLHSEPPDVCFSKNSRNLITASDDGSAFLWNVYNGTSVKLVTKCMESYSKKCAETKPTEEGPLYRVTCLDWSCDDSLVYIGDSVYSRGNLRKPLSSMRTIESGFTVFDGTNGNLIGHALYGETNFHLSMIKSNPVVPWILLVANYGGYIYIYSCEKKFLVLNRKIECGPGGCWLDILWHPSGSSFVISQKFGCFSIFTVPSFTYKSTPTLAYIIDPPNRITEAEPPQGRFLYGYGSSTDFPPAEFEPVHYFVLHDMFKGLMQPEPSSMNKYKAVDDLDIFQSAIDLSQFIYVHRHYNLIFDGIVNCFHHIQTRNFELVRQFHDYANCPICVILIYGYPPTREYLPSISNDGVEYTRYGDHMACLPPSIQTQIQPKKERVVKPRPISILQKLVSIVNSESSSDSEDSDFSVSSQRNEVAERPKRHRRVYRTRTVLKRIKSIVKPAPPKPKLAQLALSSSAHLLNNELFNTLEADKVCSLCGVSHVCFLCEVTGCKLEAQALHYNNVIGDVDSRLIGPIVIDKQALDTITTAFGSDPVNEVYFHLFCLSSIDDIVLGPGTIGGLDRVLYRSNQTICSFCSSKGAILYCKSCNSPCHPRCSIEMYKGCFIFPSTIVGEFICLKCSKKKASHYLNLTLNEGHFPWIVPDALNLPVRATRSRLKAHMYYRRLCGKGSESILPQQGDILWFSSLITDELAHADEMLSFYLHFIEPPFTALVLDVHHLFSGYQVEPARLALKLRLQLIYPPHYAGIQFHIYTWRGDPRYTLLSKIVLGLALQEQLVDQDSVLVYQGIKGWIPGRISQVVKCRRLLEFEGCKDILSQLSKAIEKSTSGNRVSTELDTVSASGWDLEPTGDPLSVVAGVAERIMEEEFPRDVRDFLENILDTMEKKFMKDMPEILMHRGMGDSGESNGYSAVMGVPVPLTFKDIKTALSDGLLRQQESVDELMDTLLGNALVLGVRGDVVSKIKKKYYSLRKKLEVGRCPITRIEQLCKISFTKPSIMSQ